jgi:hypothetical protein
MDRRLTRQQRLAIAIDDHFGLLAEVEIGQQE